MVQQAGTGRGSRQCRCQKRDAVAREWPRLSLGVGARRRLTADTALCGRFVTMGYRWTTALHVVASITTLATVATVIVVGHGRLRPGRSTCSPIPETGPMPTKVLLAQDDMQLKQFGTDRKSPAAVIVFLHGHLGSFVQGQPFADRARSLGLNLAVYGAAREPVLVQFH